MIESDSSDYSSDEEETLKANKIRLQHSLPAKVENGQVSLACSHYHCHTELSSGLPL